MQYVARLEVLKESEDTRILSLCITPCVGIICKLQLENDDLKPEKGAPRTREEKPK